MTDKTSLFKLSELPDPFGVTLLILSLILLLSPYFSGADFGVFKIPILTSAAKKWLKVIGPILFIVCTFSFAPIITINNPSQISGGEPNPIITPTLSPDPPQISSSNQSSSKPESPVPTSSTILTMDAKTFGNAGTITTREDKQIVNLNLQNGEHLLFKLSVVGAQPVFGFACQHRALWGDTDFPESSANHARIWPKDRSEVDSDYDTYAFHISFAAAFKYTLLVEHLDKDGKILEVIKSKDYQSSESSDSFTEIFQVRITG